jgi:P-type Cu+ transporter
MTAVDIAVLVGAALVTGGLWWFFFGPRHARVAELHAGVQEVQITVKGGYSPDLVRARLGVPLRLVFDRKESGDCSSRVLFPDFGVSRALPAFARSTVEFTPEHAGQFGFACGMNMIHGTLLVDPSTGDRAAPAPSANLDATHEQPSSDGKADPNGPGPAGAVQATEPQSAEDAEAAERRAEIADLVRRIIVGAMLSTPVVVAVMASDLFHAGWVPHV